MAGSDNSGCIKREAAGFLALLMAHTTALA